MLLFYVITAWKRTEDASMQQFSAFANPHITKQEAQWPLMRSTDNIMNTITMFCCVLRTLILTIMVPSYQSPLLA